MLDLFFISAKIVSWILTIYLIIHIAAFLLSWIQADIDNPIVSFINRITIPLWNWVGEKLPRSLTPFAPYFALMLVIFGEIALPGTIKSVGAMIVGGLDLNSGMKNIVMYIIFGGLYITSNVVGFLLILSILWFIFTLVNPPLNNPFVRAIWYIIDPLITPLQRVLPRAKIDLSPLALALIAFIAKYFVGQLMIPFRAGLLFY